MTTADRRTSDLANRLAQLATNIHSAKDHIAREYAITDGLAAASLDDDGSRSTSGDFHVERTVMARARLAGQSAQINDDLDAIEAIIRNCTKTCAQAIGTRAPTVHERCTANPGLDGYLIPLHEGGWFDPTCQNLPRSSTGLCNTCRVRLDRWRQRNDKKPADDERTIDYDCVIREGQRGAVHALPIQGAA